MILCFKVFNIPAAKIAISSETAKYSGKNFTIKNLPFTTVTTHRIFVS